MKFGLIVFILIVFMVSLCYAPITNFKVPSAIRLGENLTIRGDYGIADSLCKFLVLNAEGDAVERLSDEYTFSDGSFYSQRQVVEPPYYRGDDFNVFVTCGSDTASATFDVNQPVGLAQPLQMGWEYVFDQSNQNAIFYGLTFIGLILIIVFAGAFFFKIVRSYNAS